MTELPTFDNGGGVLLVVLLALGLALAVAAYTARRYGPVRVRDNQLVDDWDELTASAHRCRCMLCRRTIEPGTWHHTSPDLTRCLCDPCWRLAVPEDRAA